MVMVNGIEFDSEKLSRPGIGLIVLLLEEAERRGQDVKSLALTLNVTYGYVMQLVNGMRQVPLVTREFLCACAEYLDAPVIAVMVAAGFITSRDLVKPGQAPTRIREAIAEIRQDPAFGPWLPGNVEATDDDTKAFLALCYQKATGRQVLTDDSAMDLMAELDVALGLARAASQREEQENERV